MASREAIDYVSEHGYEIGNSIIPTEEVAKIFDAGRKSIRKVWIIMESEFNGCHSDNWVDRPYKVCFSEEDANNYLPEDRPGFRYYINDYTEVINE